MLVKSAMGSLMINQKGSELAVLPNYCTDKLINGRLQQSNIRLFLILQMYLVSYHEFLWSQIKRFTEWGKYSFCYLS